MKIGENSLYAEMQILKGEISPNLLGGANLNQQINHDGNDFNSLLSQAIKQVNQLQKHSANLSHQMEMGDPNVTIVDTVIAREKASVAFEATMQVRNKLVDAYKEIMSMPV